VAADDDHGCTRLHLLHSGEIARFVRRAYCDLVSLTGHCDFGFVHSHAFCMQAITCRSCPVLRATTSTTCASSNFGVSSAFSTICTGARSFNTSLLALPAACVCSSRDSELNRLLVFCRTDRIFRESSHYSCHRTFFNVDEYPSC
jgi:hypothetical protein